MIRLLPPFDNPDRHSRDFVYGGTDAFITRVLSERLEGKVSPFVAAVQCALLPPVLACMARGLPVNEERAREMYLAAEGELESIKKDLQLFVQEHLGWGGPESPDPYNPGSDDQTIMMLHGDREVSVCPRCNWSGKEDIEFAHAVLEGQADGDWLRYKSGPRKGTPKHKERVAKDRICLEKHQYPGFGTKGYSGKDTTGLSVDRENLGRLIVRERGPRGCAAAADAAIKRLEFQKAKMPLGFLGALRGPTGRYMYELGIGMTDTFRFNSKANVFGEGSNIQNQQVSIREVFEAPEGRLLGANDFGGAESHWAAALSSDEAYLRAHEGECDTHAFVAHMMWPDLDWPEDVSEWKKFASTTSFTKVMGLPFSIPKDSLRDVAKSEQHGVTRGQSVRGFAEKTWMSYGAAKEVHEKFFDFAQGLAAWMERIQIGLRRKEVIHLGVRVPPVGFEERFPLEGPAIVMHVAPDIFWWRKFGGDPKSAKMSRLAITFALQSPVTMTTHLSFLKIWNEMDSRSLLPGEGMQLLADEHDEILYEFDEQEAETPEEVRKRMMWNFNVNGRGLVVPVSSGAAKKWSELK